MKHLVISLLIIFNTTMAFAQNVGIGTNTPNANAALEVSSTNKGFLTPRLSSNARMAMSNVAKGMMVYDTTQASFYYHDGGKWKLFSERNVDSLTTDQLASPAETVNISGVNIFTSAHSGILYDNGGPAGNYGNDTYQSYFISNENVDSLVGFKVVVEQMNLAANDSLVIVVADDIPNYRVFTGSTTGTYYFPATSFLGFIFFSDETGAAAGFRIRWSKVVVKANASDAAPAYGWYFNAGKIAVRGGIPAVNGWIADSLGRLSFAYGANARANAKGAVAFGSSVNASGEHANVFGNLSQATGKHATAMGLNSKALADYAFASGNETEATGRGSLAIGLNAKAGGTGSVAIGNSNIASGNYAVALGNNATASGLFSLAAGNQAVASGEGSIAFGDEPLASGSYSFAGGNGCHSLGTNSFSYGTGNVSTGTNAVSFGHLLNARSYGEVVIGRYNKNIGAGSGGLWNSADLLFVIANGTQTTPNNILNVFKNGRIGIYSDNPDAILHIGAGTDASLSDGSGYMVIGNVNSSNLVFDNNEIVARNNGANNTLFLQNDGGPLEVGGTAAKPGGGSWSATSDARLKKDIYPYSDGLQQVLKINPVYFNYNNKSGYDTSKQYIGIIAQELKEVAPYMVDSFEKDGTEYYKADNTSMTYMLINAVKEQQKMIEWQQQQLTEQQKQVDELKALLKESLKIK